MIALIAVLHALSLAAAHTLSAGLQSGFWILLVLLFTLLRFYRDRQRLELVRLAIEKGQPIPPHSFEPRSSGR